MSDAVSRPAGHHGDRSLRSRVASSLFALLLAAALPQLAGAQVEQFDTAECFAFWRLLEKLQSDGVAALLDKDPRAPADKPTQAEMERIRLYIDLEERLSFRCPRFAPPPARHPDRRPGKAAKVTPSAGKPPSETAGELMPLPLRNPKR